MTNANKYAEKFNNSIEFIARAYQTSYCRAVVYVHYKYHILLIGILMLIGSLILEVKPLVFLSAFIVGYAVKTFISGMIRFKSQQKGKCSDEYYEIQTRISEILQFSDELQHFNHKLNNTNFLIAKCSIDTPYFKHLSKNISLDSDTSETDAKKDEYFIVLVKVASQIFPVCIVDDAICKEYFIRELDDVKFDFWLEMELEKLKSEDLVIRYWFDNTGKFNTEPISEEYARKNNLYYGINYFKLQVICR